MAQMRLLHSRALRFREVDTSKEGQAELARLYLELYAPEFPDRNERETLANMKRHPTLEDGVVVGAGAKVLGAITIGARSRIGANAVVVKPVPPGATAVGNPARILQAEAAAAREEAASRMGFSAYGVTQGDDPVAQRAP